MIKDIIKDTTYLTQESRKFDSKTDEQIVVDLLDTANEHYDNCLGLAGIQIGYPVKVFAVKMRDGKFRAFINPLLVKHSTSKYEAEEGCLSLDGTRKVTRYDWVDIISTVGKRQVKEHFSGLVAEVIQHEYDHLKGKLI